MSALYDGFFARFALPLQLHSDQGRNFESRLVAELIKLTGIRRTCKTPFHPQSDGQTERMNKTLLQMLRATAHENPNDWPMKISIVFAAYRMTLHKVTKISPNQAMLARELRCPCTFIAAPPNEGASSLLPFNETFRQNMRTAHEKVRRMTKVAAKTEKSYYHSSTKEMSFHQGQWVDLYQPQPLLRQRYRKLQRLWIGPYEILSFKSDLVVEIRSLKTSKRKVVHIDRLWPYHGQQQVVSGPEPTTNARAPTQDKSQPVAHAMQQDETQHADIPQRQTRCSRKPARYKDYVTT